jgi:hypothetical protein
VQPSREIERDARDAAVAFHGLVIDRNAQPALLSDIARHLSFADRSPPFGTDA